MARKASLQPTEVEMAILRVLWDLGPSSVRAVHDALREAPARAGTGYSTTAKMMQVMFEKGLVKRDDSRRPQIYRATRAEAQTQRRIVDDLIRRVFGGSARKLVLRAVESEHVTPEDMAEIRKLLDSADQ